MKNATEFLEGIKLHGVTIDGVLIPTVELHTVKNKMEDYAQYLLNQVLEQCEYTYPHTIQIIKLSVQKILEQQDFRKELSSIVGYSNLPKYNKVENETLYTAKCRATGHVFTGYYRTVFGKEYLFVIGKGLVLIDPDTLNSKE